MKAAVFDPYLDTLGGGEVYTSGVIEFLLGKRFIVDILWQDKGIKHKIKKYLGINVREARINQDGFWIFKKKGNILEKRRFSSGYDLFFFVSDGSLPWLFAKKNIMHFQIPFTGVHGSSFVNQLKLRNIHHLVCNSFFTKNFIDREFKADSRVIYPPINIAPKQVKKQNTILSVGRFTTTLHNKRQDILIEVFKQMVDASLSGWHLKLIGSSQEGEEMIKNLKLQAEGYPIQIIADVDHRKIEEEYSRAKIFWHVAGYGIDEQKKPELVEHFGIATAEAMSAGCVPVVINKGGQPEIVDDRVDGFLWNDTQDLKEKTLNLMNNERELLKISKNAIKKSHYFSKQKFLNNFSSLLSNKKR